MSASHDYDLIVIGGGAAGLTAAGIAANAGVRTLLVEAERRPDGRAALGGDCTWHGCIPSKALLHLAAVAHTVRHGAPGVAPREPEVDFAAAMAHVRALRERVYDEADDPAIYEAFGAEVVAGRARFTDPHVVEIETATGVRLATARLFILATGGRPAVPPLAGLAAHADTGNAADGETGHGDAGGVPFLTNRTLFELTARPDRLLVLGGGPVGVEMAQAFRRLGAAVTLADRADRLLGRDDADHARVVQDALAAEGVAFALGAEARRARRTGGGALALDLADGRTLEADALLVATGRRPNVEHLGLDAAGVATTDRGITVDERCRTSQRHIFAVGDCTGEYQLTHMSEHMAKVAATNAVLKLPLTLDRAHVPWVTFTAPELAHLGAGEAELHEKGRRFETYRFPYTKLDRALTDGDDRGEVKVFATKWTGKILGASVVGARAGEVLGALGVAMRGGVSLRALSDTIHAYPTYGLSARRAADQWYARKQYPRAVRLLQRVFDYRGQVPPPPDPDRIV